ncbi:MAG: zinc ribbon domain-containing protein [Oscillospiraceae bacterium]|jgi:hypothetical protein|nr:zinc ribbon domain-containing protein [Oscillospiraceae bacterium]
MYACSKCGGALNPDGVCPNCGTVHNISPQQPVQQQFQQPPPQQPVQPQFQQPQQPVPPQFQQPQQSVPPQLQQPQQSVPPQFPSQQPVAEYGPPPVIGDMRVGKNNTGAVVGVLAGVAVVAALLWIFVISPGGAEKVALDYVKEQITSSGVDYSEYGAKISYKVAHKDSGKGLYVVDVAISMTYEGVTMSGGTLVIIKVDGKNASEFDDFSYGDMGYYDRDEALSNAKERVKDY